MRFVIQDELDTMVETWNNHWIRPSRNSRTPNGRPSVLYTMPELVGAEDYLCPIAVDDLADCEARCEFRGSIPCDADINDFCLDVMAERDIDFPRDWEAAIRLYKLLHRIIQGMML